MTGLKAFRMTMLILAGALGLAVVTCLLPENEYQRWQLLDDTIHKNARWIYERSNFDPTPIDVAFLGPSRIGMGIDTPLLARLLAEKGEPANVVNFSLPEAGRNINLTIAEQLFRYKRPRLVVIGVTEKPSRFGHSAFKYVAPVGAIANPGYFPDLNYFSDLIYLPFRQGRLFFADLFPGASGLTKRFDPSEYRGSDILTVGDVIMPDGTIKEGERPAPMHEILRGVHKLEAGTHPPILPKRFADYEFGDERHYVREVVKLAQARGSKVVFLMLPYYSGPSAVQDTPFYTQWGPLWNASFLSTHPEWYADYGHLTHHGADILTTWLSGPVASALQQEGKPR
ncbi:MAG TPA: hypothetical protein VHY34_06425 [Caulobacteraceae bacterium]|jgi:hypothetical protein|nr:hypothetical protein [Caulobacteraceae bacterium]